MKPTLHVEAEQYDNFGLDPLLLERSVRMFLEENFESVWLKQMIDIEGIHSPAALQLFMNSLSTYNKSLVTT